MDTICLPELVADLRALGLSAAPTPFLADGARAPLEILDRWARAAALGEPRVRRAAIWAIREVARVNSPGNTPRSNPGPSGPGHRTGTVVAPSTFDLAHVLRFTRGKGLTGPPRVE